MGYYQNENPSENELYYLAQAAKAWDNGEYEDAEYYEAMARKLEEERMEALREEIWDDDYFLLFD